eukprot:gene9345-11477_t
MIDNSKLESIGNYYDTKPELFDRLKDNFTKEDGAFYIENPVMKSLVTNLEGKRCLDIGCGYGTFVIRALKEGAEKVYGIDISNKMITEGKKMIGDNPKADLHVCPMEELDRLKIEPQSLDLVTSYYAMMYSKDYPKLVKDVNSLLKKNGRFIFIILHPIYTSGIDIGFHGEPGKEFWPVRDYSENQSIRCDKMCLGVNLIHRTMESLINTVIEGGFSLEFLREVKMEKIEDPKYYTRPGALILSFNKN